MIPNKISHSTSHAVTELYNQDSETQKRTKIMNERSNPKTLIPNKLQKETNHEIKQIHQIDQGKNRSKIEACSYLRKNKKKP